MRPGSRIARLAAALVVAVFAVAPLAFGGCGSSGGSNPPLPLPLTVKASPAGANYDSAQDVTLTATGEGSSGAVLYYTTDLSVPDDTSPVYSGPIPISTDTVLKFYAQPTTGDPTDEVLEGYTFKSSGIGQEWAESGHGQIANEAWRHWDGDGQVKTDCAKCHSGGGFKDWAMDGTVDAAAALPMGLECSGCHSAGSSTLYDDLGTYPELDHVTFPSGDTATLAGDSNLCMGCHQGRSSMVQVDAATPNDVEQDPDYPSYSFINIHYYPAAASYLGSEVRGGYQYLASKEYQARNTFPSHPDSLSTCTGCHMQESDKNHTWFPDLERCEECHTPGSGFSTLGGSPRANWSAIQTALSGLYADIRTYANTLGYPIVYDDHAYPYFFNDNGAGLGYGNKYDNFDEKLLHAAYNYQFGQKEPCGYLHNGTYMRQILHDSIVDLGGTPTDIPPGRAGYTAPSDLFVAKTDQFHLSGHNHAGSEVFRHWDKDPAPQTVQNFGNPLCSQCHTSPGFAQYAKDGSTDDAFAPLSVVGCIACHSQADLYSNDETRWDDVSNTGLRPVTFPSGDTADLAGPSNVCMGCHKGLASGVTVQDAIDADAGVGPYSFINIHYYAAAASLFGADVEAGYQYRADGDYRGQTPFSAHPAALKTCVGCHMRENAMDHTWEPDITRCNNCHAGSTFETLSTAPAANYTEIQSLLADLLFAIESHASGTIGKPIFYDGHEYPYFFNDNGGGAIYPNRYVDFDASLLAAAYNYQVARKEPCGYIHNGTYIRQILYDSLDDLDNWLQDDSVAGATRP